MAIIVNTKGFDNKIKELKKFMASVDGRSIIDELAVLAADLVYKRVKAGGGVTSDTAQKPRRISLKRLSTSYIRNRKAAVAGRASFKAKGKWVEFEISSILRPGKFFSPGRSNLTRSGQMLEALFSEVTTRGFKIAIKNSSRPGEDFTNAELAKLVSDQGRQFLALTDSEQRIILRRYEQLIRVLARRRF